MKLLIYHDIENKVVMTSYMLRPENQLLKLTMEMQKPHLEAY